MLVIGIDPKPSRGGWLFQPDGQRAQLLSTSCLGVFLRTLRQRHDPVLICWDSPLTGPPNPAEALDIAGEFTKRCIYRFFTTAGPFRVPDSPRHAPGGTGISVQGYAACQHWAISRHLLGLPRVGIYDRAQAELPFTLLMEEGSRPEADAAGSFIVEVHPALALWLWCRFLGGEAERINWLYKREPGVRADLWESFSDLIGQMEPQLAQTLVAPGAAANDDDLDARIAWLLGEMWLRNVHFNGQAAVILLGNLRCGTFLLPNVQGLQAAFNAWQPDHGH
jgi:hypothetical protein